MMTMTGDGGGAGAGAGAGAVLLLLLVVIIIIVMVVIPLRRRSPPWWCRPLLRGGRKAGRYRRPRHEEGGEFFDDLAK